MNNKDYIKIFSTNLRFFIGNMSVTEFAKRIGIPQQTISRYLLCQRTVSVENLIKIADYFDENIDSLLGRKNF